MILERPSLSLILVLSRQRKAHSVEIRIGIENSARELNFETNQSAADVEKVVNDSLESGIARFVDDRDRVILVNATKITFVEIGEEAQRRVGFVA